MAVTVKSGPATISGNTITLNNNLTAQASGTYSAQGLVYAGSGPANIPSTLYQNTYVIVRYYDDFDNSSGNSAEQIVIPYQPTTVDVVGPPNVSSTGLSTTSGIDSSGTLGFNGYINLSWSAVTDSQLRGYRIRFTTDTTSPVYSYVDYPIDQSNPPTGTLSYKLTGLAVGATYKLAVATYDQYNNLSTAFTSLTDTTITGSPAITNYISAGNFKFGYGVNAGTDKGLYLDANNYWYINSGNSARLKVGGSTSNYLLWDGSAFTIDGNISARGGSFQGNVALTASGASIYSGDVTTNAGNLTGDGFILNSGGLLIRKTVAGNTRQVSLDTTTGGISANYGSIAGWDITSASIEKLNPTSTKYAGLSPSGTYAFWAGSTVSGGDTNQFAVDRTGKVWASSMQISGGALDIGATSSNLTSGFHVTSAGKMYATDAVVNGTITAIGGKFTGNVQLDGGSLWAGTALTGVAKTVMNSSGFAAYSSTAAVTEILTTPIGDTQTTPGGNTISMPSTYTGINFFTKGAIIGGWIVNDGVITSDLNKQITLTSGSGAGIVMQGIVDINTNYTVGMSVPSAAGDKVFWAGDAKSTANFYVDTTGKMSATGAVISSEGSLGTGSYVKIDGAADNLTIYGLATNHPGASQTFTATITGGAIQSAYSATISDVTTKTTTTLNSGNISTDGFMSIVATKGFQVFDGSVNTANAAPMISITPSGGYTSFQEVRDGILNTYNGSAFVSNASVSFLNSGSVILGSGVGISGGSASSDATSYVYINGYARIRNSTPVGYGTGSYVRNTYVSSTPPSQTTGFVGDLWVVC